jgi:starch synthase (maltosyl-transferring)
MDKGEGRLRAIIEGVKPEIDGGRFPIKRVTGEKVTVEADIFTDGHDALSALLRYRREKSRWNEVPMEFLVNDRWRASFTVPEMGKYSYTLTAWVDHYKSWRRDLAKKVQAVQQVSTDLLIGSALVEDAVPRAIAPDARTLREWAGTLQSGKVPDEEKIQLALSEELLELMDRYPDRRFATDYSKELEVVVDREKAGFSAWYEMFPRSCVSQKGHHATFKDCQSRLPYIAELGFDVLYFPPIHPIGRTNRKGKNNALKAGPGDPGTPWAIGSEEGGHKSIHPGLGTLEDFRELLAKAKEHNIEIALDIAFQCSPDHPYVKEHPDWFRHRPDGTIQYAENPPKKYEDIYPLNFETENWRELWEELKSVFLFWLEQGVRIFRVDNPHTKPFAFWEWAITGLRAQYPDVIFLSEAFTRPKVMYRLAKLGFTQSYTYFAWRNTRWEFTQYLTELTGTEVREFFRPSLWTNTPDILTEYLQVGGRPAFLVRLVLAATLGASYGIYGPAFELMENRPRQKGSEEYLNSEKYEIKHWDIYSPDSLRPFIARINRIRRENPALHRNDNLLFHHVDNDDLICYSKHTDDLDNIILVVVNLHHTFTHSGWVELPLEELGLRAREPYQVHDLLNDARYVWNGPKNYVELNPHVSPAHIFRINRRFRT